MWIVPYRPPVIYFQGESSWFSAVVDVSRAFLNFLRRALTSMLFESPSATLLPDLLRRIRALYTPDPELPLHGCYVSVTIQKCTEGTGREKK
jgi:hypothetical protein